VEEELQNNCVAIVFILALVLDYVLPRDKNAKPVM
jgi:hypothetical protein